MLNRRHASPRSRSPEPTPISRRMQCIPGRAGVPYPASHANGTSTSIRTATRMAERARPRRGRLPAVDLEPVRRPAPPAIDGPDRRARARRPALAREPARVPAGRDAGHRRATATCSAPTRSSACTCRGCARARCRPSHGVDARRCCNGLAGSHARPSCQAPGVIDPANGVDDEVRDLFVRDGRIVRRAGDGERIDRAYDAAGMIVMAGGIDLHTHIGGGKVNLARLLMPEDRPPRRSLPATDAFERGFVRRVRPARWPPATATSRWATPRRSSRRWCRATRATRTWRWATRRSSTTAPT